MRYAYKNEDFLYSVDFKVNGNFVMPDDNVYSYKIRNQKGEVLLNETVNIPETSPVDNKTEEVIPVDRAELIIPAEFNNLSDGFMFNTIIVEINFKFEGKPYTLKDSYRVIDFFYFNATAEDVRNYYGLNSGELPDEAVDLNECYFKCVQKLGTTFTDCLNSGGIGTIRANRLITLYGVVQVFSSVRLRVNQEENDGSSKFLRYLNKINWDAFLEDVQAEIEELEANLSGEESVSYTDYMPFYLGAVTDAITGEES